MDLPVSIINLFFGIAILIGALECFFGYRVFKTVLGLIGFLAGAILGAVIGYSLSGNRIVSILAGILGGFIGAGLLVTLYFVGVFVIGALLGGILAEMLFTLFSRSSVPVVIVVLAVIGGVLAVIFQKFMIIVSTSFSGAYLAVNGLAYLFNNPGSSTDIWAILKGQGSHEFVVLLCVIVLGSIGMFVQYRSTRVLAGKG
jgi:hypothetical protein